MTDERNHPEHVLRALGRLPAEEQTVDIGGRMTDAERLMAHCRAFILRQRITCGEATVEDRIYENAPEFIEGICEIVGYYKSTD